MSDLDKRLEEIFSDFSDKQCKVINERMGLKGDQLTLQSIGDSLGITRERVRQIEAQVLDEVAPKLEGEFEDLFERAREFLNRVGGVRREDYFLQDARHISGFDNVDHLDNKVRFIFEHGSPLNYNKENDEVYPFWYVDDRSKEQLFSFLDEIIEYFNERDKDEILEDKVYIDEFNDMYLYNYIPISKEFGVSVFGDFGLREWPEIEPKVVRDKAYLVLKKRQEPLHFEDIANLIGELGIDEEPAHTQTVHNELIKSDKFVLVGRGMYGLKEHGFEGGTAKDVIENLLKEKGPLPSDKVVKLVNDRKMLKDNTILLNLQNKDHFERLEDGRYDIKEA